MGTSQSDNWAAFKAHCIANAKSQADMIILVSKGMAGEDYEWGEEGGSLKVGGPYPPTADPHDRDCSGHIYTVYYWASEWSHEAGFGYIKSRGGSNHLGRSTAAGFKSLGTYVGRDVNKARAGDVVCFKTLLGRWYHIALVGGMENGVRMCDEARGEKWGVIHSTLASVLARSSRAYIYRFAWLNLGPEYGLGIPVPTATIPPQVRYGSTGPNVSLLQRSINKLGYKPALVVDGKFGRKTLAAVYWLQAKFGIWRSGVCGPRTWAALLAAVAKL
jgi:hypothetical protein